MPCYMSWSYIVPYGIAEAWYVLINPLCTEFIWRNTNRHIYIYTDFIPQYYNATGYFLTFIFKEYTKIPILHNQCPTLQWLHNERSGVSNHRRLHCLLDRLFRHRAKKISKLRVAGLCEGNPSVTGWLPSQRASNAENVSIWWRHHEIWPLHQKS